MNTTATHLFPQWGTYRRWNSIIGWLLAALLALLWLAGYGPGGSACKPITVSAPAPVAPAAPIAAAPAPAPAPAAPAPAVAPAVAAVPPAAKVYFALDKFDMPTDPNAEYAAVVAYLKANPGSKAVISGFHDPSGNKAHNEELALNRARTVRAALDKDGIPADRVVMSKPMETTGTGAPQEARRVEISVQQ